MSLFLSFYVKGITSPQFLLANALVIGGCYLLILAGSIAYNARAYMLVNQKTMRWNCVRYLKLTLWTFLISFIFGVLIVSCWMGTEHLFAPSAEALQSAHTAEAINMMQTKMAGATLKSAVITGMLSVLLLLLLLPILYISIKYMMEPESHFHQLLVKSWKTGMRHWGYIFLTLLLTMFAIGFVFLLISIPLIIVTSAYFISAHGVASGDAAGLPGYFNWIYLLTSIATYFIYLILTVFCLLIGYYLYGSVETREAEKKQLKLGVEQ